MIQGLISEMKLLEVARIQREKIFEKEKAMKLDLIAKVRHNKRDDSDFYLSK